MQSENVIESLNKSLTSECNDDFLKEFIKRIQTYIDDQIVKSPLCNSAKCGSTDVKSDGKELKGDVSAYSKLLNLSHGKRMVPSYLAKIDTTCEINKYGLHGTSSSLIKWIKKPLSLSPAICSQYGWKCIKSDLLECVTCGAKLSAQQPKIGNFEAYKACLEKMLSDLKDSHGKHCPWPLTPSPENFVRMVLMPKEEALNQFLKRMRVSLSSQSSCPKIEESISSSLGFSEYQILALTKMVGINNEEASLCGRAMVSLAATGWTITEKSESVMPVFECNSCQRSVWSGSFRLLSCNSSNRENESETDIAEPVSENSVENNSEITKQSPEPPTKKRRTGFLIRKGEPFDPLHEHRPWCLWIHNGVEDFASTPINKSSDIAKRSSNIPGWKIFIKSLLKNISDSQSLEINNSPSREQIKNVKSLLEKWTDAI